MLLKADAPPPKLVGLRVWPKAIPQFNVAHKDVVKVSTCRVGLLALCAPEFAG